MSFLDDLKAISIKNSKAKAKREQEAAKRYASNPKNVDKVNQYNAARKEMGLAPDKNLTQTKYRQYFGINHKMEKSGVSETTDKGVYNRYKEYYKQHPERKTVQQTLGKPFKKSDERIAYEKNKAESDYNKSKGLNTSFDKKVDKGLVGLNKLIKKTKPFSDKAKDLSHSKLAQTIYQLSGLKDKANIAKLAIKGNEKIEQYGGADSTRNVIENATDHKDQSLKEYLHDVKDGFTGKRRATGEEIAKNLKLTNSKYGNKAIGLGIEVLADPTNLLGAGAYKVGSKALKGVGDLGKLAKVTKEVEKVKPLLLDAPKPGAKFENAKVVDQPINKLQETIGKLPKKEPQMINVDQLPKRPKGSKLSRRKEPNGVLIAEGLMEKPIPKTIKPAEQIKEQAIAKVNSIPTVEKISKDYKDLQDVTDIKSFQTGTKNVYELAERLPKSQRDRIVNNLDSAKSSHVNYQQAHTDELYNDIVKAFKFKKGSKESALIQDYGERTLAKKHLESKGVDLTTVPKEELDKLNLSILQRERPRDWRNIVQADEFFRNKYNQHIDKANQVRAEIYPNNPDKQIPKLDNYYHHFQDLTGLNGIKNAFSTPANIDPQLEGISAFVKPKSKFQGFMQKRGLGKYKSDAIGGYLKYLQGVSHSIHIDPMIPILRGTADDIAEATTDTKNANKIIEALQDHANDFAGKTNPWFDRSLQKGIGRVGMNGLNALNSRAKSNMILGNLGSALGQLGNVPLGIAKAKTHSVGGLVDTVKQTVGNIIHNDKTAPIYKSEFLKERFVDKNYRKFDQRMIDQPKKMAVWILETADKAGSKFIWNSMYKKGLADKVPNPMKYADTETRKIVAGRGVGEVPLIFKSKTSQMFIPFQYEVGNQWKVLSKMVGEKDAAGLITFMVASYGLNKAIEHVRGSAVSYDPIDALIDGYSNVDGDKKAKIMAAIGSLTGETIGNIPGGNLAISSLGDKKILGHTIDEIFQGRNPNRFGTGLVGTKPLTDPLTYGLTPWGGVQLKKTMDGMKATREKGTYTDKGELKFPINTGLMKNLQMGAFGPNSTSEARDYYGNNRRPLGAKDTQRVDSKEEKMARLQEYLKVMKERKERAEKRKLPH